MQGHLLFYLTGEEAMKAENGSGSKKLDLTLVSYLGQWQWWETDKVINIWFGRLPVWIFETPCYTLTCQTSSLHHGMYILHDACMHAWCTLMVCVLWACRLDPNPCVQISVSKSNYWPTDLLDLCIHIWVH